jgi:hypothetical protein
LRGKPNFYITTTSLRSGRKVERRHSEELKHQEGKEVTKIHMKQQREVQFIKLRFSFLKVCKCITELIVKRKVSIGKYANLRTTQNRRPTKEQIYRARRLITTNKVINLWHHHYGRYLVGSHSRRHMIINGNALLI